MSVSYGRSNGATRSGVGVEVKASRHGNGQKGASAAHRSSRAAAKEVEQDRRSLLETKRELARAQKGLADLLANVSHDLRTPLTNLREFVSIVQDGLAGPLSEQQREYLGIALRNVDTLAEMIEHLLVVARIQQGNFHLLRRRVRLPGLLNDDLLLKGVWPGRKLVHLSVQVDPSLPDIYADPDRLLEALRNLVDNAIKYSGDSVKISIGATESSDSMVELCVKDNGLGMAPVTLKNLFKRFYRGHLSGPAGPSGLGVGLSIVKEIVDLHGGRLSVRSTLGKGTEFRLGLPTYEQRGILLASVRSAWRKTAEAGAGFSFARVGIRRWSGALSQSQQEMIHLIRERLRSVLQPDDELLLDCEGGKSVCFFLGAGRDSMEAVLRKILRAVADRLSFQSALDVEWEPGPQWVHSDDFSSPEEMAEAIFHRYCCKEALTDVK